MLQGWAILGLSFAYLGTLFAIAFYGDQRAKSNRSLINNPYVYALSLAVYCTSWTFFGSIGQASQSGIGFLPTYLGPTLMLMLGWLVLRKIIRISKTYHITSIADFLASRYGQRSLLGGIVAFIAVVGIIPYIALQLKAIADSLSILLNYPALAMPSYQENTPVLRDTTLYIAMLLAAFTIIFGTRHLDASERHEGMVAAVAFESLIKLLALLVVGLFVTFGLYRGFADVFAAAQARPDLQELFVFEATGGSYGSWALLTLLSMFAIVLLPRQFQVAVVENVDERHLRRAIWIFPLYLVAINLFVLPISFAGRLTFAADQVNPDYYLLALPIANQQLLLALIVFIGGMAAATGMVIVETIALSTMVSNNLVMPVLLQPRLRSLTSRYPFAAILLGIRRSTIVLLLLLAYGYFRLVGDTQSLVSIGLVSFVAVAQFAPAFLGGLYWKGGSYPGALLGLIAGFLVWLYTLILPTVAQAGWFGFTPDIIEYGPFGIALLKPLQLFGLAGLDPIPHALIWSMLLNCGLYVAVSLFAEQHDLEQRQASRFVHVFEQDAPTVYKVRSHGTVSIADFQNLLERFLGPVRAREAFAEYARRRGCTSIGEVAVDADVIQFVENRLAGAIGTTSARVLLASMVKEETLGTDEMLDILEETSQIRAHSEELEQKSQALEQALQELQAVMHERELLNSTIRKLSSPVLPVHNGILVMPLIGEIDAERAGLIIEVLLDSISKHHARAVIIDMTGLPCVDIKVGRMLLQAADAVRLLGTDMVLVGIGPHLAQSIVGLDMNLIHLVTCADLQSGISHALAIQQRR